MLSEFSLEGKVAIVTGAGRGIGRGISLALADAGAAVIAVARTETQIKEVSREVQQKGQRSLAIAADVTSASQVEAMVNRVLSEFGQIDILVNNAGVFVVKTLVPLPGLKARLGELIPDLNSTTSEEEWHRQMNTNVTAAFLTCRAVGPHMMQRKSGKIINITSTDALRAFPYHIGYASSKAALANFTKHLAFEWARHNINVNSIAPGFFRTDLSEFAYKDQAVKDGMLSGVPMRRFGETREIGLAVVFLASKAADYITGWTIPVDGGLYL